MSKILKTQAIVLRRQLLLKEDLLITFFTSTLGKTRVIAKGVRRMFSRRSPHLLTGNYINSILSYSNSGWYLQQTQLISGFSGIRNDQAKLVQLYNFFYILDQLLPEEQPESSIFLLTKSFLIKLSTSTYLEKMFLQPYLQKLLVDLGYLREEKKMSLAELIAEVEEICGKKIDINVIM